MTLLQKNQTDIICLNADYSTTRLVSKQPALENQLDVNFAPVPFSPVDKGLKCEGGLRTQGYFKYNLKDKPLISVITVVLNGEKCFEETIKSVINQTYDNVEYIIIDGGSTDGTLDIICNYEGLIDYWVSEKDEGIYDAMNKAVLFSSGDWIYILGSDDTLFKNSLHEVAENLIARDSVYYGNVTLLSSGKMYGGAFSKYKLMQQNICHQAIFYPANVFKMANFNTKYRLLADYEFNIRLFGKYQFKYLPINIATYNDNGASSFRDEVLCRDLLMIVLTNFGLLYYIAKLIRNFAAMLYKKQRIIKVV